MTSRGLERREIVHDDADRARWLDFLAEVSTRRQWRVLAWVLMDKHTPTAWDAEAGPRGACGAEAHGQSGG